jgi:hypothetical protein
MTSLDPGEFHRLVTQATDVLNPTPPPLPDILTRARRRRRRRTSFAVTGAVALAGAAAAAIAVVATPGTDDTSNLRPAAPAPATTPPSSASVRFGSMTVTLPDGWSVLSRNSHAGATNTMFTPPAYVPAGEVMCIGPRGASDQPLCPGLEFARGGIYGSGGSAFVAHQPDGWYQVADVENCPNDNGTLPGGTFDGVRTTGAPIHTGFAPVGGKTAVYDEYQAHCDGGFAFTPRSWYLPTSKYRVIDYLSHAQTAWVLAHIHWTK